MSTKANSEIILAFLLTSLVISPLIVTVFSSYEKMVAVYGSTPTIDGFIEDYEWNDASSIAIPVTGGANCTLYAEQDGANLYVGFDIPDTTYNASDGCGIILDVNHDENISLQTDDIWLASSRKGSLSEKNVTFGGWYPTSVSDWKANASSSASGWQSEYNITYSKVNVTAGTDKTLGINFLVVDSYVEKGWYTWASPWITEPATWGDMTSNGYNWIPEFSTWSLLPSLLVLTVIFAISRHRLLKT